MEKPSHIQNTAHSWHSCNLMVRIAYVSSMSRVECVVHLITLSASIIICLCLELERPIKMNWLTPQGTKFLVGWVSTPGGGDLTKNHHKAQPQHSTALTTWFYQSLSTGNNPLKSPQKESYYLFTTTVSGRLLKTPPFFYISLCRYCLSISPLKLGKWMSLLVDFG